MVKVMMRDALYSGLGVGGIDALLALRNAGNRITGSGAGLAILAISGRCRAALVHPGEQLLESREERYKAVGGLGLLSLEMYEFSGTVDAAPP